jgi:hypothetical protein
MSEGLTLRSPFAEALQEALRHAPEDHAYPGWVLESRWRGYLMNAQEFADQRAGGFELPDWRQADHDTPTLAYGLLAFIGEDPPADLLKEVDKRMQMLEANDPGADRRHLPTQASVASTLQTVGTVRHLIEKFRPSRRLS